METSLNLMIKMSLGRMTWPISPSTLSLPCYLLLLFVITRVFSVGHWSRDDLNYGNDDETVDPTRQVSSPSSFHVVWLVKAHMRKACSNNMHMLLKMFPTYV